MDCRETWVERHSWVRVVSARVLPIALVFAVMAGMHVSAFAWGAEGHRLIAEVAEMQLTAVAKAEVDRLLALDSGATLVSVSTWADEVRSPSTAHWHYVNFPRDANCRYEPEISCLQGSCVVGAIERQVAVLASKAPDDERLKALKYVIHFVADVHQPLHAGFADDRGGNTYQLQAFGRGTNLHVLWDSGIIKQWPGGLASLQAAVVTAVHRSESSLGARAWAEESCRLVSAQGFYPAGHKLVAEDGADFRPMLVRQLAAAGARLAALLNQSLAKR